MQDGNLTSTFNRLKPFRALVLGDFFLDTYTKGKVRRISPEAPVQVLEVESQESRAGGAGNAVLNLIALGGTVFAMGRIGSDFAGKELKDILFQQGADVTALLTEEGYGTPVKNRIISYSQQLMRIDLEKVTPANEDVVDAAIEQLKKIIPQVQVVAISDYAKGFLTNRLLQMAISLAGHYGKPCIIDPKGSDFTKYRGATLIKPNLMEAYNASKMAESATLDIVANRLLEITDAPMLMVTRSEDGISLFEQNKERRDFPVRKSQVKDVTGAGDTVLAVMCLGLASGIDPALSIQFANIAAGIAIERVGCASVQLSEIAERLLDTHVQTKIFDENHTYVLEEVLKRKKYALLVLERLDSITAALFRSIRQLASSQELILYIESDPEDEFVKLLSSLHEIKAIILQKKSLQRLLHSIHPEKVFICDGNGIGELPLDEKEIRRSGNGRQVACRKWIDSSVDPALNEPDYIELPVHERAEDVLKALRMRAPPRQISPS